MEVGGLRIKFDCDLDVGPSTGRFLINHETLFDKKIVYSLRKGAPVVQMLEAPEGFVQGSTEPWIVDVLCALLKASDQRTVVECGAFVGATTVRLARTLADMGGGTLTAVELDPDRAATAQARLDAAEIPLTVTWRIVQDDVLRWLAAQPNEGIGFAFLDDDHGKQHVADELHALIPKMVPNGLITGHDVWGSTDLQDVFSRFGGYALDLPRLGPAGGLGILQIR